MISHGCDKGVSVILTLVCIHNAVVEKRPCRSLYQLYSELKECPQNLVFSTLQNLRIVEVRRNLRKFSIQPPLLTCRVKKNRLLGSMTNLVSNITKHEVSRTCLNQCSATVTVKTPSFFLCSDAISSVSICACCLSSFQ